MGTLAPARTGNRCSAGRGLEAEILSGLRDGERVIRHPSNQLEDEAYVVAKE